MRRIGLVALACLALAACGGSGGGRHAYNVAVDACVEDSGTSLESCECAAAYLQARGKDLAKIARQEATAQGRGELLADPEVVRAAMSCAGR